MTKAIFLDLDGTLLNDKKEITPGNRAALDEMLASGHKVIVNTGRPLAGAIGVAEDLELDRPGCYLSTFNGGLVYDMAQDKIMYMSGLSREYAPMISEAAVKMNMHIQFYDEKKVICERHWEDDDLIWYCNRINMEYEIIDSVDELRIDPIKISGVDRESTERLLEFGEYIMGLAPGKIDAFLSSNALLEIVAYGQNKGTALRSFAKELGIPIEGTVAVGDEANDISMIEAAHIGVAMCNGTEETRAAADVITENDNNHDGVAEVIRKYIL